MLSVKQGGIKYHFSSLWYDSTWILNPGLLGHRRNPCKMTQYILTPCLGDATIFTGFTRNFFTQRILNCLNFWDKAWWFLSFRFLDNSLHLYCWIHKKARRCISQNINITIKIKTIVRKHRIVLEKHGIFYTYEIPEVMRYEPLYNNPIIKFWVKGYLYLFPSFLPSLNSLAAFHWQRSRQQVKWGKKKTKSSQILNPKP